MDIRDVFSIVVVYSHANTHHPSTCLIPKFENQEILDMRYTFRNKSKSCTRYYDLEAGRSSEALRVSSPKFGPLGVSAGLKESWPLT